MGLLTAVVLTRNEERHLPDCLASLRWADHVLVLDSGSTDATLEIARRSGARVASHPFTNYSQQRQHALSLVETPWVLFVDADERIPQGLATEIQAALAQDGACAYWIPRENYFWGRRLRGGGWWPDEQLRLLSVDHCHYDTLRAVHEVAAVNGETAHLTQPMVHLNYDDWAEFLAKQHEYAALEAQRRRAGGESPRPHNYVLQPLREFWRRYATLSGWRDGMTGLLVCAAMGWFELLTLRMTSRAGREA